MHAAPIAFDKHRILFLDFLRIFAFASVLVGHDFYQDLFAESINPVQHDTVKFFLKLLLPFFNAGAGVTVFFLVSGYIITHILQTEKPVEFAVKRIFRIYPLYVTSVLLTYLIAWTKPNFYVLIPQLLLIGDAFNTPYAIAGIEWTLRVEMMFYILMLTLKVCGFMNERQGALPWMFLLCIFLANFFAPFPSWGDYSKGSYSIAFQFLFLGTIFYLNEIKRVSLAFLFIFTCIVFYHFFHLTRLYAPHLLEDNYAILGLLVFLSFWICRDKLKSNRHLFLLSNLTYAVYLFHLTIHDVWDLTINKYFPSMSHSAFDLILFCITMVICYFMARFIEKPFNKFGHKLAARFQ
jgi:peptidoglycan/LPS O-acetylase OafA/YrhL